MTTKATKFIQSLRVPTGPLAGKRISLAPFQQQFLRGSLAKGVSIAALSVARGGGKSTLTGGIALGHILGEILPCVQAECLVAARNREQGRIVYDYVAGLARSLPDDVQKRLTFRKAPRLEIEYESDTGANLLKVLPADGRSSLGTSPSVIVADEAAHWREPAGTELEQALLSGIGKRGGRYIMISTSADSDAHRFSKWLDEMPAGGYAQEHRADAGCAPDDIEQIRKANPGAEYGIGASLDWLQQQARRAMARGGSSLTSFRLYNLNQRVSAENRDVLLTTDEWLRCESDQLPPRQGPVVIGCDLGGSASMTASAFYWYETGRLECLGWYPSQPNLADRGAGDGVGARYTEMASRGELSTLGAMTVPVAPWLSETMRHVEGEQVVALCADRYKQAEIGQAIDAAGIRVPIVWRGFGFKDGNSDCDGMRRACFDGLVKAKPSLLLRSAFADAVVLRDPANNMKLTKARSLGRIDAASASVLAIAHGARLRATPIRKPRAPVWA